MTVSLLVNAYDRTSMPLGNWLNKGLLRYYNKEKSSALVDRSGLYMTSLPQAQSSKGRIYTDADLVKYRNSNPFFSGTGTAEKRKGRN